SDGMDFAALLEASFARKEPERGEIISGTVLAVDHFGLIVDVGIGRDGVVPRRALERLPEDYLLEFHADDEVDVMVGRSEDEDGNRVLSVSQARQREVWRQAEKLMENDEVWEGIVTDANRGRLIVPCGNLRGFVPASHVTGLSRGLNEEDRKNQ